MRNPASGTTTRIALALAAFVVPLGIAVELGSSVPLPLLDLASGWVMAASAVVLALSGRPRSGILVAAAALAWFAGTAAGDLLWVHRAVLATAVLGAPDAHLTTRRSQVAVVIAWVGAPRRPQHQSARPGGVDRAAFVSVAAREDVRFRAGCPVAWR